VGGMRSLRLAFVAAFALNVAACMPPQTPTSKLTDHAYTVAEAARFGRMDIVMTLVDPAQHEAYSDAHAEWGGAVRILDVEYGGARLVAPNTAVVVMNVAWQRLDEAVLRSTSLKQTWKLGGSSWVIAEEVVASGDKRLLLEPDPDKKKEDGPAKSANSAPRVSDFEGVGVGAGVWRD
jgi:hypothetical protein